MSYIENQGSSYNGQMSNRFHVLSEQRDFTRKNFQRHAQPQHHGNYMAESAVNIPQGKVKYIIDNL